MNTVLLLCSLLVGSALGGGFVNTFTIASVSAEWGAFNGWASNLLPSNKPCANTATIWNAGRDWNDYPQAWIVFDLASGSNTFNVQGVVYNAAGDGVHDPNLVQIQTSSSVSGPWTTVTSFNGEFSTNKSQVFLWSTPTAARYWKFNIVSTATGYQAYVGYINFIYTAIVPLPTPAPTPTPTSAPTTAPTPAPTAAPTSAPYPNPAVPAFSPTNCTQWNGSALPNNVKFQLYHSGYQASHGKGWATYTPIYGGTHPLGMVLDASPKTWTLDSVGNAKWPKNTVGQEGRVIGDNGQAFTDTWGGDYIIPGANSWGVSFIPQTAPFAYIYLSQISAAWGYTLGVQAPTSSRGNQILINLRIQDQFAVYICP